MTVALVGATFSTVPRISTMRGSDAMNPSTSQSRSSSSRSRSTSDDNSEILIAFSMESLSSSKSNGFVRYSVAPAFMASTAVATFP